MTVEDNPADGADAVLTPAEVAKVFRVNPKTSAAGRGPASSAIRILGGHRWFRASEIERCLADPSNEEGT